MDNTSWLDGDDNWLEAEILVCPCCGTKLFCILHSPMCDDHRLYCDRCPRSIEISYYDRVYERVIAELPEDHKWEQIVAALAPLLKPCPCGAHYGATTQRHCFKCGTQIPAASNKDLSPYTGVEDTDRDPTPAEQAEFDRFAAEFIRTNDLWLGGDPDC